MHGGTALPQDGSESNKLRAYTRGETGAAS